MSNILVTGSDGQLGNEFRQLAPKSKENRYYFTDVQELDITDLSAIRDFVLKYEIKVIINCAAYTNVENAEDNYAAANRINNEAVKNLALACKEYDACLIHVSTDYVFQGNGNLPYKEDDSTEPIGVYGQTKLAGEQAILDIVCSHLIFRTAWLYSSFGNNFVKTILRLSSDKEQINVIFDQVGTPTYAGDLAILIFDITEERLYLNHQGIYHFSNEGVCSWYDFAQEIVTHSGNMCKVLPCYTNQFPSKVKRPIFSVLDKGKVKADFNYEIPYWKDSLVKCIKLL